MPLAPYRLSSLGMSSCWAACTSAATIRNLRIASFVERG
jgi:hypothetical protein